MGGLIWRPSYSLYRPTSINSPLKSNEARGWCASLCSSRFACPGYKLMFASDGNCLVELFLRLAYNKKRIKAGLVRSTGRCASRPGQCDHNWGQVRVGEGDPPAPPIDRTNQTIPNTTTIIRPTGISHMKIMPIQPSGPYPIRPSCLVPSCPDLPFPNRHTPTHPAGLHPPERRAVRQH